MSQTNNPSKKSPAEVMREIRLKILTTPASEFHLESTSDFPKVCSVLMDWPMGTNTVTVFSSRIGDASIYTTGTFGVIGGIGHERVRSAATNFVKVAGLHYEKSMQVKEYPYPSEGHVYFYLICYDGVRRIEADLNLLRTGKHECSDLYSSGQDVITELRKITEKQRGY